MASLIPLRRRNGHIAALTRVDDADYEFLSRWTWRLNSYGYAVRGERRRNIYMHRVLCPTTDEKPEVDHIDRDTLNNQRSNLRPATRLMQIRNSGARRDNTSGYKGVSRRPNGRWRARCERAGRTVSLGDYDTPELARTAYAAFHQSEDDRPGTQRADSEAEAVKPADSTRQGDDVQAARRADPKTTKSGGDL